METDAYYRSRNTYDWEKGEVCIIWAILARSVFEHEKGTEGSYEMVFIMINNDGVRELSW